MRSVGSTVNSHCVSVCVSVCVYTVQCVMVVVDMSRNLAMISMFTMCV